MSNVGCYGFFMIVGLIFVVFKGAFVFLTDFFTSPLLYFFIAVQVIAYFIGRWKKNRNHLQQ